VLWGKQRRITPRQLAQGLLNPQISSVANIRPWSIFSGVQVAFLLP
jgi:hypothetical protein